MPRGAPAPLDHPQNLISMAIKFSYRARISQLRRRPPVGAGGRQDGAGSDGSDGHAPAQRHET